MLIVAAGFILMHADFAAAATTAELLTTIKSVEREGKGNAAAQKAWKELAKADASELPAILQAFEGASPLAANWLRAAVEAIASRTQKAGGKLPVAAIEKIVLDKKGDPRGRRVAFVWLRNADAARAEKVVPGLLLDPSPDLRREAVARLIGEAEKANKAKKADQAKKLYQEALSGAVEDDQVKAIVAPLKKLGVTVNLKDHFGFLTEWSVIGPFDNTDLKGFDTVYPPEKELDLKANYKSKFVGRDLKMKVRDWEVDVKWTALETSDQYGIVDVAKDLTKYSLPKDVLKDQDTLRNTVMYATTEFVSPKEQTVQFRLGTPNSWKLWVNGKLLFGRQEYHRGMMLDQYRVDAKLKPGKNVILLKISQNDQAQRWMKRYQYQIRVCDSTGSAVRPVKETAAEERND